MSMDEQRGRAKEVRPLTFGRPRFALFLRDERKRARALGKRCRRRQNDLVLVAIRRWHHLQEFGLEIRVGVMA